MSAPVFIAKSTRVSDSEIGGVGSSVNLDYMGSILAGDLLLICALNLHPGATIGSVGSPGAFSGIGVNAAFQDSGNVYAGNMSIFARVADGSETGFVTVTGFSDVGQTLSAQMYQFRSDPAGKQVLIESSTEDEDGDGAATIDWNAISVNGAGRTLLAFVVGNFGAISIAGYVSTATDSDMELHIREDVASDGAVTSSGGNSSGWATAHISLFSPLGRSFIVN